MALVTELLINGEKRAIEADGERSLLSVLRDDLDLTGTKYGCGEGQCGACTVHLGGAAVRSCVTPVGKVGTKPVTTIEGLAHGETLHPLQQAFLDADSLQCGYCTSGMIMSGAALLERNHEPTRAEVLRAMDGNVCRCGCYVRILAALGCAAKTMKEGSR
jgi:aerobic-type carbon monoxide dehydrogenase small subunit (CoxS/CutS family)